MIFKRGNRLFASGSILLILVAALHSIGHFAPPPAGDAKLAAAIDAMRGYQFDIGFGMLPSFMDVFESISLTMSIMILFVAWLNLTVLSVAGDNARLVRRLTVLNAIGSGALVVLYAYYRVPPPLISFAVVEVIFILALIVPDTSSAGD